jgi:hypothetical protein
VKLQTLCGAARAIGRNLRIEPVETGISTDTMVKLITDASHSGIVGLWDPMGPCWPRDVDGNACNCLNEKGWALNSAVECHLHTVEVVGSNPTAPTISFLGLAGKSAP